MHTLTYNTLSHGQTDTDSQTGIGANKAPKHENPSFGVYREPVQGIHENSAIRS